MKKRNKSIAFLLAALMVAGQAPSINAMQPYAVTSEKTLSGKNRYKTAVEVSKSAWINGSAKEAIIVSGNAMSDALSATPLAYAKNAPILLTDKDKLNEDTKAELKRLGVSKVYIVGGDGVVTDKVKAQLEAEKITVERISGRTRQETSLKVAKTIDGSKDVSKVAVVNGFNGLPDAISIGAYAAKNNMPILLTDGKQVPSDMETWIKGESVSNSYVIGGDGVVTDTVKNKLPNNERVSGKRRGDTNAAIIDKFYTSSDLDTVYVANDSSKFSDGSKLVDALAVGPVAAKNSAPVVILGDVMSEKQRETFFKKEFDTLVKVGGGISTAAINELKATQNSTVEVRTVNEFKNALDRATTGDVINFKPSANITDSFTMSTTKAVTVNLSGTYKATVTVDMPNGKVNNSGTIDGTTVINKVDTFTNTGKVGTVQVKSSDESKIINGTGGTMNKVTVGQNAKTKLTGTAAISEVVVEGKDATVEFNGTVSKVQVNSGVTGVNLTNKGTISDMKVYGAGCSLVNNGTVTKLDQPGDMNITGSGTIGNETLPDASHSISSIKAVNTKTLQITFSKAIDKDSVIDVSGNLKADIVDLTAGTGATDATVDGGKATLENSGTVLKIVLPNGQAMKGNYLVDVKGVSSNSVALDSYNGNLVVSDKTAPTTSVVFNTGTDKFEVTLSEPIDSGVVDSNITVKINNTTINKSNLKVGNDAISGLNQPITKFEIDRSAVNVDLGSNATIEIYGIKDNVGNTMSKVTSTVAAKKESLSIADLKYVSDNKIRLTFNKQLNSTTEEALKKNSFTPQDGSATPIVTIANTTTTTNKPTITTIAKSSDDLTGRSYDITLSELNYVGGNNQTLKLTINTGYEFTDVSGTKTKFTTANNYKTVTMIKDTTAPSVTSMRLSTDRGAIEVSLSEAIGTAPLTDKVSLFKDNVKIGIKPITKSSDGKTLTIIPNEDVTDGKLNAGSYKLRFEAGALVDLNGVSNKLIETQALVVKPESISVSVNQDGENYVKDNKFDIVVTGDTFTNASKSYLNFAINGSTIDARSTITITGGNTITVTLPKDTVESTGEVKLTVKNLSVASGKTVEQLDTYIKLTDNSAPELLKGELVKGTTHSKLVLTFDEEISNKDNCISNVVTMNGFINDLEIKGGSASNNLTTTYNFGKDGEDTTPDVVKCVYEGNKITMYITNPTASDSEKSNWNDIASAKTVSVKMKTAATVIKDLKDNNGKESVINIVPTTGTVTLP